jgi:outer membrane protein assembly factor BamB
MTNMHSGEASFQGPLRLWPGVVAALLLVLVRFVVPAIVPTVGIIGVLGGVVLAVIILVWWLFFSRAPWSERLGAVVLMIVALAATYTLVHESIRGGMMGRMLPIWGTPGLTLALVAWAVFSRHLRPWPRRAALVGAILLACGVWTILRTDGITGEADAQLAWRWTPTAEERLLAQAGALDTVPSGAAPQPSADASTPLPEQPADVPRVGDPAPTATPPRAAKSPEKAGGEWPGFRGPGRDAVTRNARIATDWSASPPAEVWRRPIGPGWSSFAVDGDRIFTQEQRGEYEVAACYSATTGKPVWVHRDPVRFYESNGGPGPRGTPTVHNGRVYTFGATGIVNALDARNGALIWTRNAAADTGTAIPGWGFASSPLVVDDVVVVAASGQLAAYDAATGKTRWLGPEGGSGYSSPHLVTIDGAPQILLLRGSRTISVAPADGVLLWEHVWEAGVGIVQPALVGDRDLLLTVGDAMGGLGMRRIAVSRGSAGWTVEERWTTRGLKPYFNDFVVHGNLAFGFDGSILACIDLGDGARKWKGGRYGHGQMVLLPEQDLLLVLSEEGELALVKATADQYSEVARFKAIEGKTWNHPVLVGGLLLVRNGEEMAAFRMPAAGAPTAPGAPGGR